MKTFRILKFVIIINTFISINSFAEPDYIQECADRFLKMYDNCGLKYWKYHSISRTEYKACEEEFDQAITGGGCEREVDRKRQAIKQKQSSSSSALRSGESGVPSKFNNLNKCVGLKRDTQQNCNSYEAVYSTCAHEVSNRCNKPISLGFCYLGEGVSTDGKNYKDLYSCGFRSIVKPGPYLFPYLRSGVKAHYLACEIDNKVCVEFARKWTKEAHNNEENPRSIYNRMTK